jgi:hypothetical protein
MLAIVFFLFGVFGNLPECQTETIIWEKTTVCLTGNNEAVYWVSLRDRKLSRGERNRQMGLELILKHLVT